jgi:hypothetical protein
LQKEKGRIEAIPNWNTGSFAAATGCHAMPQIRRAERQSWQAQGGHVHSAFNSGMTV